MKHSNRKILNILLIGVLMLGFAPAGLLYAHHCKGGHADDPGCDGGGNGPPDFSVDLGFRDIDGDRIQSDIDSDPDPDYVDGDSGVSTRIRDDGLLLINITGPRALIFDFTNPTTRPRPCAPDDCKLPEDSIVTAEGVAAAVQVVDGAGQHLPDNLLGMVEDVPYRAEMKFGWGGGRKVPRFNVRFQFPTLGDPIDDAIDDFSTYVEIERTSQTVWVIEAGAETIAGDEALLFSTFKDKGPQGPPQDEGSYMMPFSLIVSCPSCP